MVRLQDCSWLGKLEVAVENSVNARKQHNVPLFCATLDIGIVITHPDVPLAPGKHPGFSHPDRCPLLVENPMQRCPGNTSCSYWWVIQLVAKA